MKCKHCGREIKKSNAFDISGNNITEIYCHVDNDYYPSNSRRRYCADEKDSLVTYAEPDIAYERKLKLDRI
jgi:hypothetical protein